MVEEAGATIDSILVMPDPETIGQEVIVEEGGICQIQFGDGTALVDGTDANGYHVGLGFHSFRLPNDDLIQEFRFVAGKNGREGQQRPRGTLNKRCP